MTRHPFDSGELGRNDPEMDRVGAHLERYAAEVADEPPIDLVTRIQATIDEEPVPATGWWASLLAAFSAWQQPARLAVATAVVVAAVVGAFAVSGLVDRARNDIGTSPVPSVIVSPSPIATATPTPTAVPTPTPTSSASPSASGSAEPTASDDDDDEVETPDPSESESDNSGPGGGDGDDNSGPGGDD
jgi:hypothetical protein